MTTQEDAVTEPDWPGSGGNTSTAGYTAPPAPTEADVGTPIYDELVHALTPERRPDTG